MSIVFVIPIKFLKILSGKIRCEKLEISSTPNLLFSCSIIPIRGYKWLPAAVSPYPIRLDPAEPEPKRTDSGVRISGFGKE